MDRRDWVEVLRADLRGEPRRLDAYEEAANESDASADSFPIATVSLPPADSAARGVDAEEDEEDEEDRKG